MKLYEQGTLNRKFVLVVGGVAVAVLFYYAMQCPVIIKWLGG